MKQVSNDHEQHTPVGF